MIDLDAKSQAITEIIDGRVVSGEGRVAICIKGLMLGFPVTLEAVYPGWPFGVMYTVETKVVVDPEAQAKPGTKLVIYPRMGKGLFSILTRILLFESSGLPVNDKKLESRFIFSYDDASIAERFIKYPRVAERLINLDNVSKFTELTIKTSAGLFLTQPTSFKGLNLDVCRATFRELTELGQIIFEAF